MNIEQIQYALAKQLDTAHTLSTDYGDLPIDAELQRAIAQALRPILDRRLDPDEPGATQDLKTLPYEAVEDVCNQGYVLTAAISDICNHLLGEYADIEYSHLFHRLILVRTTADLLAGMFDHMTGGNIAGGLAECMGIPDMELLGVQS